MEVSSTTRHGSAQDEWRCLQVVLPEGAYAISAAVPFPVNQSRQVKQTYLDTTGRPVVFLHKINLVPDHDLPFTVTYSFFSILMLREPILLVCTYALVFAAIIAWVRCDFVLSRDDKWQADRQQEKAVALVQKFVATVAGEGDSLAVGAYNCSVWSDMCCIAATLLHNVCHMHPA